MRTTRACAALAAVLLLTLTLTACGSDSPATTAKAGSGSTTSQADEGKEYGGKSSTTASGSSSAAAEGSDISIKNFAFSPQSLKGAMGTTVTITNDDSPTHTWTADDGSWDSGDLAPGKSYEHTFDKAGTFTYHCNIHRTMKGTVVVS